MDRQNVEQSVPSHVPCSNVPTSANKTNGLEEGQAACEGIETQTKLKLETTLAGGLFTILDRLILLGGRE